MGGGKHTTAALVEVRETLAEARARGLDFDAAWSTATAGVKHGPHGYADALSSTRGAWRQAYLGEPERGCGAMGLLLETRRYE
jgi:hypothetical protein